MSETVIVSIAGSPQPVNLYDANTLEAARQARIATEAAASIFDIPASLDLSEVNSMYDFTRVNDNIVTPIIGTGQIDLNSQINPNWERTANGVLLRDGVIETEIQAVVAAQMVLYRSSGSEPAAKFLISGGASNTAGVTFDQVPTSEAHWWGCIGEIRPLNYNEATGLGCKSLDLGGWSVYHRDMLTTYANRRIGIAGSLDPDFARADEVEVMFLINFNTAPTAEKIQGWYDVLCVEAAKRGVYIRAKDCPQKAFFGFAMGNSNIAGQAQIADLPTAERTAVMRHTCVSTVLPAVGSEFHTFDTLEMSFNQRYELQTTQFGPVYGFAKSHRETALAEGVAYVVVLGFGGSYFVPNGTYSGITVSDAITWNAGTSKTNGLLYAATHRIEYAAQQLLKQGIGFDEIRILWSNINDAKNTAMMPNAAAVAANYQPIYDHFVDSFKGIRLTGALIRPQTQASTAPSLNATALTNLRDGENIWAGGVAGMQHCDIDAFVTANPSSLNADKIHWERDLANEVGDIWRNGQ